jgi:hypothetical protein
MEKEIEYENSIVSAQVRPRGCGAKSRTPQDQHKLRPEAISATFGR